ncbi:tyrosine-type recombinase/integrase [Streptomyces sp. NPDC058674]|uniref:tyrosine-type recombinase/integrase n=1 Tax=Streptomyces sp. NPDC058674 TaxID=3346592 RepID=UPI00365B734E
MPAASTYGYRWRKALKAAGLVNADGSPKYTPHSLRHFFASTALTNGVPIHEVSRWLGHKSINRRRHLRPLGPRGVGPLPRHHAEGRAARARTGADPRLQARLRDTAGWCDGRSVLGSPTWLSTRGGRAARMSRLKSRPAASEYPWP